MYSDTRNSLHGRARRVGWFLGLLLACSAGSNNLAAQMALGSSFTYQGQMKQQDSPYQGTLDLEFKLYDAPDPASGTQIGPTVEKLGVEISNGLFSVELDFGVVFTGARRWLEIGVKTDGGDTTTLVPLQELTASPYALFALNSPGDADADPTNELQSLSFHAASRQLSISSGNTVTLPSASSWNEITADTAPFLTHCEHRWTVTSGLTDYIGSYFYATVVRGDLITMDWSGSSSMTVYNHNKASGTLDASDSYPVRTFRRCE